MIQFNLLPDVKVEFIKTQRLKRVVLVIAFAAAALSVGLLVIMFSFSAVQKKHLSDLNGDISTIRTELESEPELSEMLSIQNQLNKLPALYDGRPAVDRLPVYLDQTTPVKVGINRLALDLSLGTLEVSGTADTLESINSYVDTLKYTTYKITSEEEPSDAVQYAFSQVVLTRFSRDDKGAVYNISFVFDPTLFDITKTVELIVPNLVTTRAQVPSAELFNGATVESVHP